MWAASEQPPWWLHTAFGQQLLAWQQRQCDAMVADIFGYHSVQLGLPALDALRCNRMPQRWTALLPHVLDAQPSEKSPNEVSGVWPAQAHVVCEATALPFATGSVDLLVLAHVLERSACVQTTLQEAARALVPEGQVLILGFNPISLWALYHRWQHASAPNACDGLSLFALRRALRHAGLCMDEARFTGHTLAAHTQQGLRQWRWLQRGVQWLCPTLGGAYCVRASKHQCAAKWLSAASWRTQPAATVIAPVVVDKVKKPIKNQRKTTV